MIFNDYLIVLGADSPGLHAHHGLYCHVGQSQARSKLCIKHKGYNRNIKKEEKHKPQTKLFHFQLSKLNTAYLVLVKESDPFEIMCDVRKCMLFQQFVCHISSEC